MNTDLSEIRDALAKAKLGRLVVRTAKHRDLIELSGQFAIKLGNLDHAKPEQAELIANAPAWLAELCDRAERAEAAWTDFTSRLGYGDDKTERAATPDELVSILLEREMECRDALEQIDAAMRVVDPSPDPLGPGIVAMMRYQATAASEAEAAVDRVRAKADAWAALLDNAITTEGQTLRDAARDILRALDGAQ